jgi:hypothetical protein
VEYLETFIHLPPGPLSVDVARDVLQLALEVYRWFPPVRYGFASMRERLDPERIDYDALLSFFEEEQLLCVGGRTDQRFMWLFPSRPGNLLHSGKIIWATSLKDGAKTPWRGAHWQQVAEVMRRVGSPLAVAADAKDIERKTNRLVPAPDGIGMMEEFTVRNYSEGLAGLFWRNFYGPPFVRMFGERLGSLPGEFKHDLGDGVVLVQPYELPSQAGTPEGTARERELIAHLGPPCFYDHEQHTRPTQVPALDSHLKE